MRRLFWLPDKKLTLEPAPPMSSPGIFAEVAKSALPSMDRPRLAANSRPDPTEDDTPRSPATAAPPEPPAHHVSAAAATMATMPRMALPPLPGSTANVTTSPGRGNVVPHASYGT